MAALERSSLMSRFTERERFELPPSEEEEDKRPGEKEGKKEGEAVGASARALWEGWRWGRRSEQDATAHGRRTYDIDAT